MSTLTEVKDDAKLSTVSFLDLSKDCDYLEKASFGNEWAREAVARGLTVYGTEISGNMQEGFEFETFLQEQGLHLVYCKPFYRVFSKEDKKTVEALEAQYVYRTYVGDLGIVNTYINSDQHQLLVDVFSHSKEWFEKVVDKFRKALVYRVEEQKNPVYVLQQTSSGVSLLEIGGIDKTLLRENYSEDVSKKYDLIAKDIRADAPSGRLSVLSGPPGTGKTWFIRGLVKECPKAKFVIVPPEMIRSLTGPQIVSLFVEEKNRDDGPIVLVVEDGDQCISKRDGTDMGLVSALLNMGDGILGQMLDIRIIVTSNLNQVDLDPAVLRPGRLNQFVEIVELSAEQANEIYKRETKTEETPFTEKATLAAVYAKIHSKAESEVLYSPPVPKKSKMGFSVS